MLRLESLHAGAAAFEPPAHARAADGGGFGALFSQVQAEVSHFIDHGSPDTGRAPAPARSAEPPQVAAAAQPMGRDAFLAMIGPPVAQAARELGVAPEILAAQAALETGWGRRMPRDADGQPSHNLFGVKAGASWQGEALRAATTEFEDGHAQAVEATFRKYPDVSSSVQDFAHLLSGSARYRDALHTGTDVQAYGQALMRGGYATDPDYAAKLARVARQIQRGD
jgi:flagellar protein FlgJ